MSITSFSMDCDGGEIESSLSPSLMASQLKIAEIKRNNMRKTLESVTAQSNSLMQLVFQWKDLEEYFGSVFDEIGKRGEDIELKLKQIEWKHKFLKKKSDEIEVKKRETEERLKMADERCKEIDATYELIEMCYNVVTEREDRCDYELDRFRNKREKLRDYKRYLERKFEKKELKLEGRELLVDNLEYEVKLREKKLGLIERKMLVRLEEVERREKMVDEREKGFVKVKSEPLVDYDCDDDDDDGVLVDPSYADIRLNVTMDGRALQMFLNGRVNDHEVLRNEVLSGLSLSCDPAKLVLDAINGFYPEDLGNDDVGFDLGIVRKSCVLLLEELIKLKPRIKTRVWERAMGVAMEWKGNMEVNGVGDYLEVVGFLQLVATYGLIRTFSKDELLSLFERCARHDRAPELCRNLGFTDDVHDIIQNLILRHQQFDAIRLVYAFELVDIFPPVPILKAHLSSAFVDVEKEYNRGFPSVEAQIKCTRMKLAVVDSVVRCVKNYNLESKYPISHLEKLISELKRKKRKCKAKTSTLRTQFKDLRLTLTPSSSKYETASFCPKDPAFALDSPIATQTCPRSTLALKSTPVPTEPFATDSCPKSTDASSRSASPRPSLYMRNAKSTLDPEHRSQSASPNLNGWPESMTGNKRPRLASVIARDSRSPSPAPVNPHSPSLNAYGGPVYYLQATSERGINSDYTSQTRASTLNAQPQSMIAGSAPVNQHWSLYAYDPVYYLQTTSATKPYGDYTWLPYCR